VPGNWEEDTIRAYLLGSLTEEASGALEEECTHDRDLFDLVCSIEDELIHAYLRGQLGETERERFAAKYLRYPHLRRRVDAEREWFEAAMSLRAGSGVKGGSVWRAVLEALRGGGPALRFVAVTACMLTIAAIGGLSYAVVHLRGRVSGLGAELAKERADAGAVYAVILAPGRTRGAGGTGRLTIPANAKTLVLGLELNNPSAYAAYEAVLETAEQQEIWKGPGAATGDGVSVMVPAALLARNDYVLKLRGRGREGRLEDVGSYVFGVLRE
jgi:hypothetical protein